MFLIIFKILELSPRRSETEKIQKISFFAAKISINKRLIIIIWAYKNGLIKKIRQFLNIIYVSPDLSNDCPSLNRASGKSRSTKRFPLSKCTYPADIRAINNYYLIT